MLKYKTPQLLGGQGRSPVSDKSGLIPQMGHSREVIVSSGFTQRAQ